MARETRLGGSLASPRGAILGATAVLAAVASGCSLQSGTQQLTSELPAFHNEGQGYLPVAPRENAPGADGNSINATYFAVVLASAEDKTEAALSAEGVEEVKSYASQTARSANCDGMLLAAGVLDIMEEPDDNLTADAVACTTEWLAEEGITGENAAGAAVAIEVLERLGHADEIPELTGELMDAGDLGSREGRYYAWQILALSPYLENQEETAEHYREQAAEAADFLRDPGETALLREVVAAYEVLDDDISQGDLPSGLASWLDDAQGCGDLKAFYRPSQELTFCSLEDTWRGVMSGLLPH